MAINEVFIGSSVKVIANLHSLVTTWGYTVKDFLIDYFDNYLLKWNYTSENTTSDEIHNLIRELFERIALFNRGYTFSRYERLLLREFLNNRVWKDK